MDSSQNQALIAFGSNLGDREAYLNQAMELFEKKGHKVIAKANDYYNPGMGNADKEFLNTAFICSTELDPMSLLNFCHEIETQLGRTRDVKWGNRTVDLDVLIWKSSANEYPTYDTPFIKLPHPEMLKRDFVMNPACEIAGDWIHPHKLKPLNQLKV